ncbi:hypothetical protein EaACW_2364 [Erwinia amylovora ACW56400]|uniref:Uncharacterized protein n=2 Tax=Erwinia amylovora TaxID=552 RepID=A0A831A606_ERWAM|nr:hypothetical protein EaACW_2364 [Erwinia amylovora ACW56400]CBX81228.1 hypothetical protein predicted by Glimmer/Critica [Erwinia amylovora ATCC BAA-2158]CCO90571.1 hypothetical protein BN435_2412 [Erwinia amylovora 01SFR-BO]CCO94342.1 hypothetical protein BN437_2424 [Erwinia amylovora NBRC 12687 = CFBP 1232]
MSYGQRGSAAMAFWRMQGSLFAAKPWSAVSD